LEWLIRPIERAQNFNVGYYGFTRSGPGAMQMHDLRACSQAAVRTYDAGHGRGYDRRLLTTWQSTSGPTPVSLNVVHSPQELRDAVANNQALTYAQARSLDWLWSDALRWSTIFDGMNVFPSDGPLIQAWPKSSRMMAFGAEMFVTGRTLQIAPLHVTSEVGLKEIRIYDGRGAVSPARLPRPRRSLSNNC